MPPVQPTVTPTLNTEVPMVLSNQAVWIDQLDQRQKQIELLQQLMTNIADEDRIHHPVPGETRYVEGWTPNPSLKHISETMMTPDSGSRPHRDTIHSTSRPSVGAVQKLYEDISEDDSMGDSPLQLDYGQN